jgi:hypothetical protein
MNKRFASATVAIALSLTLFSLFLWLASSRFSSNSLLFNAASIITSIKHRGKLTFSGPDGWLFYRPSLRYIIKPWNYFNNNVQAISSLNDTLKKSGIKLFFVPVPEKEEIIQVYSPFSVRIVSNQKQRFINALKNRNISVIDLTHPFISSPTRELLYQKKDTHWDKTGIAIASTFIATIISTPAALNDIYTDVVIDTVVCEPADLQVINHDTTPVPRICALVKDLDHKPYKDSQTPELLVFGDSFINVNKKYGGGLGAHLARLTCKQTFTYTGLSTNIDGPRLLLKFLKRKNFTPTAVVWVISSRYLNEKIEGL